MRVTRIQALLVVVVIYVGLKGLQYFTKRRSLEISAYEARQNVKASMYDFVVDVRTTKEWDEGHLDRSVSIPIGDFVSELPRRIPDKDARILFVCKKGIRASAVAEMAQKLGYTNVHAMNGNYKELQ